MSKRKAIGEPEPRGSATSGDQKAPPAASSNGGLDDDDGAVAAATATTPWKRPALPRLDATRDAMALQLVEADYVIREHPPARFAPELDGVDQPAAVLRLFGPSELGNSVMVTVHGFLPYFYVPAEPLGAQDLPAFAAALEQSTAETLRSRSGGGGRRDRVPRRTVLRVELVHRQSIWGYKPDGAQTHFLKISMALPPLVATARGILEAGLVLGEHGRRTFATYESNIAYVLRLMVSTSLSLLFFGAPFCWPLVLRKKTVLSS